MKNAIYKVLILLDLAIAVPSIKASLTFTNVLYEKSNSTFLLEAKSFSAIKSCEILA